MSDYHNFSSLPPHEEQTFVVYEQRMDEAGRSGLTFGAIAGVIVLVVAAGIYLGVAPKEIDYSKDMNMSNLTKKPVKEGDTAPAPAPAPAPSTAPSTAPAPDGTAPAPSGTAPAPSGTAPAPSGTAPAPSGTAPAPAPGTAPAAPAEAPAAAPAAAPAPATH